VGNKRLNIFYFVFEFLEGKSLADILSQKKNISPEESYKIISQIAQVLLYLHKKNIIHRNLSPQNILDVEGEIKVLGISLLKDLNEEEHKTLTGNYRKTDMDGYLAWEEIQDSPTIDRRVDIFSLGAIFYHCLYGQPPYVGKNLQSLIASYQHGPIFPDSEAFIDPLLKNIIKKCLQNDPQNRYSNVSDFLVDLEKHKQGEGQFVKNFYGIFPSVSLPKNENLPWKCIFFISHWKP
jgi:serine/threonine-protein kinase